MVEHYHKNHLARPWKLVSYCFCGKPVKKLTKDDNENLCSPFLKDSKKGMLQATLGSGLNNWKYDLEAFTKAFSEMVIEDELPFALGEKPALRILLEWGLQSVMIVTIDNANANYGCIVHLRKCLVEAKTSTSSWKFLHMICATHLVNLIIHDGLK
jgi:hypothetical protein